MKKIKYLGFLCCSVFLCSCSGYAGSDGVPSQIQGEWNTVVGPDKIEISNSGAKITEVMQINPIKPDGTVAVYDTVYLSTPVEWDFYYSGTKTLADFEANNVICFTDMTWNGSKITYGERYTIKFTGKVSGKTYELGLNNGWTFHKKI